MIVKTFIQYALPPDGPAQGLIKPALPTDDAILIFPLVGIPDICQTGSVGREGVFPHGVDQFVAGASMASAAVDHIVFAAFGCEKRSRFRNTRDVVRMCIHIHSLIHVVICLYPILIAKQLTESGRKSEGNDPLADELINGEWNGRLLDEVKYRIINAVFFHGITFVEYFFTVQDYDEKTKRLSFSYN